MTRHLPGPCPCGRAPKRTNQGNCAACHRLAQAAYRRRQWIKLERARRVLMRGYVVGMERRA